MIREPKSFSAKILLFGEYAILGDGLALAIPHGSRNGRLRFSDSLESNVEHLNSNVELLKLLDFIEHEGDIEGFNTDLFHHDLSRGLIFDSNIPKGYGLGSSGALCAALYHGYIQDNIDLANPGKVGIFKIISAMKRLENFFHGTSSGFDPLVSYIGQPLLRKLNGDIDALELKHFNDWDLRIFLVDSGLKRSTQPLVEAFNQRCVDPYFKESFESQFISSNNNAIFSFLKGDDEKVLENMKRISNYQLQNMSFAIPENMKQLWQNGIDTNDYYLKLCGAGGGGAFVGFTNNIEKISEVIPENMFWLVENRKAVSAE